MSADAARPPAGPVDLEAGTIRGRPRAVLRAMIKPLLRVLIGFRLEGLENVPRIGPVVVASNHLHNADPLLLQVAMPRSLHFMAKKELFAIRPLAWIIRRGGTFPVDRGKADRTAIRAAEARLKAGIAVGMFPEGTRSVTRSLKVALPGAASIAQLTGAPILPVAITGSERLPFNGTKARRRDGLPEPEPGHRGVRVRFGRPFTIPREVDGKRLGHDEATERLMAAIVALLPLDYRGVYAHLADSEALPPESPESPEFPEEFPELKTPGSSTEVG
jgi:1-acyl-sn-glycerol-3-phosphate acyltransferase